MKMESWQYYN